MPNIGHSPEMSRTVFATMERDKFKINDMANVVRDENQCIINNNNSRQSKSVLTSLSKVDNRVIKFSQAKQGLFNITTNYFKVH